MLQKISFSSVYDKRTSSSLNGVYSHSGKLYSNTLMQYVANEYISVFIE